MTKRWRSICNNKICIFYDLPVIHVRSSVAKNMYENKSTNNKTIYYVMNTCIFEISYFFFYANFRAGSATLWGCRGNTRLRYSRTSSCFIVFLHYSNLLYFRIGQFFALQRGLYIIENIILNSHDLNHLLITLWCSRIEIRLKSDRRLNVRHSFTNYLRDGCRRVSYLRPTLHCEDNTHLKVFSLFAHRLLVNADCDAPAI
ncbi:hypothetical protein AGLY_006943 [Aphis glycines]|uniref:Uncharacterized protein n=1 Tax=Aphis glycines TaxID=307491 RepID=A0A6G0TPM9_APHGL|nr:hypothetical protein AGLY_006943 [Aphis glycines]